METGRKIQGVLERNQHYTDLCELENQLEAAILWKTLLTGISAFTGENWIKKMNNCYQSGEAQQ